MAIYIKGVEISKHCIDCPFMVSRDNDDCILQSDEANEKFDSLDDMKASCPLVEIPEPHGRLIDADELKYYGVHIGDEYEDRFHDYQRVDRSDIDNAPTIIEGSK